MSHLTYFDHPIKKQKIDFFLSLVRIAKDDNHFCRMELELLERIGRKLGFTAPEIDRLIETSGTLDYIPPYELSRRFEQVYEIINLIMADGVIDKKEMRLANCFALMSGFNEGEIPDLLELLISGIREGRDEEDLYEVYNRCRKL